MMQEFDIRLPFMPANRYVLHEMVYAFMLPSGGDKKRDFLFEVSPLLPGIVVRTADLPDAVKQSARPVQLPEQGREYAFRMTAHPTRKIHVEGKGKFRTTFQHDDIASRLEWLRKRGQMHGFEVIQAECRTEFQPVVRAGNSLGKRGVDYSTFTGWLRVTDADALASAMRNGIGHAKAFGMGMLHLE